MSLDGMWIFVQLVHCCITLVKGKDVAVISYNPPTPPLPGKKREVERRQFHASHHHFGGDHDCWDKTGKFKSDDPYCKTPVPGALSTESAFIVPTKGFPGSEFKPRPTPTDGWDIRTTATTMGTLSSSDSSTNPPIGVSNTSDSPTDQPTRTNTMSSYSPLMNNGSAATTSKTSPSPSTDAPANKSTTITTIYSTRTSSINTAPSGTSSSTSAPESSSQTTSLVNNSSSTSLSPTLAPATSSQTSVSASASSSSSVQVSSTEKLSTTEVTTAPPTVSTNGITTATPTVSTIGVTTAPPTVPTTDITTAPLTESTIGVTTAPPTVSTVGITTAPTTQAPISSSFTTQAQSNTSAATMSVIVTETSTKTVVPPSPVTNITSTITSTITTTAPCKDTISNCAGYGESICTTEVYKPWARAHCAAFCGFCHVVTQTPFKCADKLPNCREFDSGDLCTAQTYFAWSREHCFAYCGFPPCGTRPPVNASNSTTNAQPRTQPHTTSQLALTAAAVNTGKCTDVLPNCLLYPDDQCVGIYTAWAKSHCEKRCGYCNVTLPCVDVSMDCDKYPSDICVRDSFQGWARENCRKFCNLCTRPATVSHTGMSSATPGSPVRSETPVIVTSTASSG